jgi:hypothetical protein
VNAPNEFEKTGALVGGTSVGGTAAVVVSTEVLIRGFEGARGRFEDAATSQDHTRAFHALFECVAWAGSLRDRVVKDGGRPSWPELEGFWFVRNRVLHKGGAALAESMVNTSAVLGAAVLGQAVLGSGGGSVFAGWKWRPRRQLPKPDQKPIGVNEYESHLEDRDVAQTLRDLSQRLAAL